MNEPTQRFLLSICIPTYKRPQGLKACVESIISQETFDRGDIEILIYDDASPDNTEQVMKSHVESVPTLRYIRNEINTGSDENIINLLKDFRGRYFFGITDDDALLPGAIKAMRRLIEEHPEVTVFESSYDEYYEKTGKIIPHDIFDEACIISKDDTDKIVRVFNEFHIYSRMFMRRDAIDLPGYERHTGTRYPHLHTIGAAMLLGTSYYTRDRLVKHTLGNETFWSYHDDYMLSGMLRIIRDLTKIDDRFYEPAIQSLIKSLPSTVRNAVKTGNGKIYRFVKCLLGIPDLRWRPQVWYNTGITIFRTIK
ncbi:MAG: glycosyltransferase family 2 protein [Candidatus Taylorbacteria bacterium]|nr:glycosyltransferase family 2 protein [Candidatus Taylorbacteria bacterium]